MRALVASSIACLCLVAAPMPTHAAPPVSERFQLIARPDHVEVIAQGAVAVPGASFTVNRERLEIPIAPASASAKRSTDDTTVRRIEVRGDDDKVLSIKLRTHHDRVTAIAPSVTYTQIGDALHVTIPRRPVPIAPPPPPEEDIQLEPTPAMAAAAPTTTAAENLAAPPPDPAPTVAITTSAPAPTKLGHDAPKATSSRWWMLLAGLALVGGGVTAFVRRRRKSQPAPERLEIIATRSLGGKSRVVWLGAGDRELVIAVTPQQVRPLAQWRRGAATGERGFGRVFDDARDTMDAPLARGTGVDLPRHRTGPIASPAVSGLIKLRERVPTVNEDVATGDEDADAQWARDLIAATGGRR